MAAQEPSRADRRRSVAPLARLLPYVRRYRFLVAGAIISLIVAACTTLTLPIAVRRMIDHGFNAQENGLIQSYFLMLMGIAALLAAASAMRYFFVITLGERVVADLRRDVFAHVTTLSSAFFDTARSGEIVSRLTADATQIKSVVGATASQALRNMIMAVGAIVMMVITSPKLSSMVIGAIPIIVLILVCFGRSVRAKSRHAQDMLADASAYAGEQISAVRTLQAFTNENLAVESYGAAVDRAFDAARSSIKARSVLTFVAIFFIFASVVAVLWFGSRDVLNGTMSAGTLSQFLLYAVLAAGALGSLSEVGGELAQAAGAAERMSDILNEVPHVASPAAPRAFPNTTLGAIEFRDVSFAYPSRPDLATLTNISFSIRPGETVAIVGPSGSGKSTIFSLLMRFYDPSTGSVLIDGVDLRETSPHSARERMAIVPQDVAIFADTAGANIEFGKPGAAQSQIEAAAHDALADGFIQDLDKGYDTQVGERGITLSGGQRQRIGIARAILRDAPILLLDEATSALDAESETLVQAGLERLMQGRTTLVIAHRLATILKADRILVLKKGEIVEEGTHQTLVQKNGVYAQLARLQFERGADAFQAAE